MLALGLLGGRVMLVDEATGEVRWEVQAHSAGFAHVAMSPSGKFVASVGFNDNHWTLWDAASGAVHKVGANHDGTGACICGEGHQLLEACPVVAHTAGLLTVIFSPCGQWLATGGKDRTVILWDAQTGEAEQRMEGGSGGSVQSLAFSANGAWLASASSDMLIRVWDATTGALLHTMPEAHEGFAFCVHFSPRDKRLVGSEGGADLIHLGDVDSGEIIRSFAGCTFAVFSPDGRSIATGSANFREVHLVDAESGAERIRMVGHGGFVFCASFSLDDGSKLASGSDDGTCKVWDSSTGALLRTIEAGSELTSLAWGHDWVRDTQRGEAFAMGQHSRLGAASRVLDLEAGVVRMILDQWTACDGRDH